MASITSIPSLLAANSTNGTVVPVSPHHEPEFDHQTFLLHIDLFILAFFLFLSLLTIPSLYARFSHKSEWSLGHILRAVPVSAINGDRWKRRFPASIIPDNIYAQTMETGSEDSHTLYYHAQLPHYSEANKATNNKTPHSVSWSSRLHVVSHFFGRPLFPGYSRAKCMILFFYSMVLLYAAVYKSSPFSDFLRTGWIATVQIPFVVVLATKNNILGVLLSVGYEKLNYLHRYVGRVVVLASNVHCIGYFYKWSLDGVFEEKISHPMAISGIVALVGLDILYFFSGAYWRQNHYNIFYFTHILGFTLFIFGLCFLHTPAAVPWFALGMAFYGLDRVLRVVKSRIVVAKVRPMPELGLTRVEIPNLNAGWRAGQHVRVRVLSSGMGMFGWAEVHPFTIASVGGDSMLLMCKKTGSWTNNLYNIATGGVSSSEKGGVYEGADVRMIVEGPYGGIGHTMMDSFSGALFICGGSGITFGLSSVQELVQKDIQGKSSLKVVELVWCVQNAESLACMLPTFQALVTQSPFTQVKVSVYYTRASFASEPSKLYGYLPPNITITPSRPRITPILNGIIDHARVLEKSDKSPNGCFVGVCGPVSLGEQVREAVASVDVDRRESIGGVELAEEIFGW